MHATLRIFLQEFLDGTLVALRMKKFDGGISKVDEGRVDTV